MTHPSSFTPDDLPSAFRDAVAIARAGRTFDAHGVGAVWNGTPNQPALVYALSRLPGVLAEGIALANDLTLDLDAQLAEMLRVMPHTIDDLNGDPQ
jgi:hypothetical protein